METFHFLWALLVAHGVIPNKMEEARALWNTFNLKQQRTIYAAIREKIRAGKFVNYNPVLAIRANTPKPPRFLQMSYADYVAQYHTTADKDGWHRVHLPDQQKTIYIKQM